MSRKIDSWEYWLDLNNHIFRAVTLSGIGLTTLGVRGFLPEWGKNASLGIIILIVLLVVMQLILGIRQISIDTKEYKQQKKAYNE